MRALLVAALVAALIVSACDEPEPQAPPQPSSYRSPTISDLCGPPSSREPGVSECYLRAAQAAEAEATRRQADVAAQAQEDRERRLRAEAIFRSWGQPPPRRQHCDTTCYGSGSYRTCSTDCR